MKVEIKEDQIERLIEALERVEKVLNPLAFPVPPFASYPFNNMYIPNLNIATVGGIRPTTEG
jgi:hypothetical protein